MKKGLQLFIAISTLIFMLAGCSANQADAGTNDVNKDIHLEDESQPLAKDNKEDNKEDNPTLDISTDNKEQTEIIEGNNNPDSSDAAKQSENTDKPEISDKTSVQDKAEVKIDNSPNQDAKKDSPPANNTPTTSTQNTNDAATQKPADTAPAPIATTTTPVENPKPADSPTAEEPKLEEPKLEEPPVVKTIYKDGKYSGTGEGFCGEIEISLSIENDKISSITIGKNIEDAEYMADAKKVVNKIIDKQSTSVDTVSGATFSSQGIIDAVADALSKAKN